MSKRVVRGKLQVPRCWKRLVEVAFWEAEDDSLDLVVAETNLSVLDGENNRSGDDDPDAYYDDCRTVAGKLEDGSIISIDLCSGQGNYYAGAVIHDPSGEVVYDSEEVMESLSDEEEFECENGVTYLVTLEWQGEDPYEYGYPDS